VGAALSYQRQRTEKAFTTKNAKEKQSFTTKDGTEELLMPMFVMA